MIDIVIIGAGVAGMTAGIYALRAGKSVTILESEGIGGQIATSPRVENFPSEKSISGSELSDKIFEQVTAMGAELELERALSIEKHTDGTFTVHTDGEDKRCKAVIIASGVKHKKVGVKNEEELEGKGISYCAVCDGAFYKGEEVALLGDANTALQYSILLSGYCKKVYVCTWLDKFFGDKALVDVLLSRNNVEWIKNVNLTAFEGTNELTACVFERRDKNNEPFVLNVKACFVAIGQVPDNASFKDVVDIDKMGYIIAGEDCRTKTDGVFVAGDCRTKNVRQLTTAVADGATSAIGACAYIDRMDANKKN